MPKPFNKYPHYKAENIITLFLKSPRGIEVASKLNREDLHNLLVRFHKALHPEESLESKENTKTAEEKTVQEMVAYIRRNRGSFGSRTFIRHTIQTFKNHKAKLEKMK